MPEQDVRQSYVNAAAQLLKNISPVHEGSERDGIIAAAALIASAPALLQACEEFVRVGETECLENQLHAAYLKAIAAIAQARGGAADGLAHRLRLPASVLRMMQRQGRSKPSRLEDALVLACGGDGEPADR